MYFSLGAQGFSLYKSLWNELRFRSFFVRRFLAEASEDSGHLYIIFRTRHLTSGPHSCQASSRIPIKGTHISADKFPLVFSAICHARATQPRRASNSGWPTLAISARVGPPFFSSVISLARRTMNSSGPIFCSAPRSGSSPHCCHPDRSNGAFCRCGVEGSRQDVSLKPSSSRRFSLTENYPYVNVKSMWGHGARCNVNSFRFNTYQKWVP